MCGLAFALRRDGHKASRVVWKRYNKQRARGMDGFGFVEVTKNGGIKVARATTEDGIEEKLQKSDAGIIMFHHRFPTSLPNIIEGTHPIKVSHKTLKNDYYVIHNGVISNDDELRERHINMGFKYTTECVNILTHKGKVINNYTQWNDSEAFAVELAIAIEGGADWIDVYGSVAFIAIQVDKATKQARFIHYGRNSSNPLKRDDNKQMLVLASQGQGVEVIEHVLHSIDLRTGAETMRPLTIGMKRAVPSTTSIGFNYDYTDEEYLSSYRNVPATKSPTHWERVPNLPSPFMGESEYILVAQEYEAVKKRLAHHELTKEEREELEQEAEDLQCEVEWYEGRALRGNNM